MDKSKQRIIQWNCRGIKPRYEELLLLLSNKQNSSPKYETYRTTTEVSPWKC